MPPLSDVRNHLNRTVFGQEAVVERLLTTLVAGGHALLVGVPGLAKTRLVEAAARALKFIWSVR